MVAVACFLPGRAKDLSASQLLIYNEFIDTEDNDLRFTGKREWMNFFS